MSTKHLYIYTRNNTLGGIPVIRLLITKEDIMKLIEDCFNKQRKCEKLECLEAIAKLILKAVENTRKEEGCEQ